MDFRVRISSEICKGCGLCVRVCRAGVLRMRKALNAKGYHYPEMDGGKRCVGCGDCVDMCPDAAIALERRKKNEQEAANGTTRTDDG